MKERTSDVLRREIEGEIASGVIGPGDRLDEQALAERFDVSRTPAREVLLQLATAGLVEIVPRQGAVVVGLTPFKAAGMMEVLHALEAEGARLAARRMEPGERRDLGRVHAEAEGVVQAADVAGYAEANARFHEAIYAGSRNAYMAEQVRALRLRLNFHRRSSLERPGRIAASWSEHGRIADAIARGDDVAARDAMEAHCTMGGTAFADMLAVMTGQAASVDGSRPGRSAGGRRAA